MATRLSASASLLGSRLRLSAWISHGFRLDSRLDLDLARLRSDFALIWFDFALIYVDFGLISVGFGLISA